MNQTLIQSLMQRITNLLQHSPDPENHNFHGDTKMIKCFFSVTIVKEEGKVFPNDTRSCTKQVIFVVLG